MGEDANLAPSSRSPGRRSPPPAFRCTISEELRFEEVRVVVAAVCEVCGKKPSFGMSVSHSHRRTKRRFDPNIQRVRALVDGSPQRLSVCTSCIRAGKVVKAPRRSWNATEPA